MSPYPGRSGDPHTGDKKEQQWACVEAWGSYGQHPRLDVQEEKKENCVEGEKNEQPSQPGVEPRIF